MRFFVITCHNVFNMWPKTTLLPVWPRDAKRLDTHDSKGIKLRPTSTLIWLEYKYIAYYCTQGFQRTLIKQHVFNPL